MHNLVSTAWLAAELGAQDLVVLDASSHLPAAGRDARADFVEAHVPGARFLDLAGLTDPASPVPSALPDAAQFAARMAALGVGPASRVVIYDDSAVKSSARAWFIFRHHAMEQVAILDGGLAKWRIEGRPMESGPAAPPAAGPAADPPPAGRIDNGRASGSGGMPVRSKDDIRANLDTHAEQVLDARDAQRFSGAMPEPRPGVAAGHVPGSLNLPFTRVLKEDGTFEDPQTLRSVFEEAGIDWHRPVVTTCGSGVTASVLLFALHLAGKHDVALYDGSWAEWGSDPDTPKATGSG